MAASRSSLEKALSIIDQLQLGKRRLPLGILNGRYQPELEGPNPKPTLEKFGTLTSFTGLHGTCPTIGDIRWRDLPQVLAGKASATAVANFIDECIGLCTDLYVLPVLTFEDMQIIVGPDNHGAVLPLLHHVFHEAFKRRWEISSR